VVCGAESTRADPLAAPYLHGVDVDFADESATAKRVAAALDAVLTNTAQADPALTASRVEFARRNYAWRAAGERYAALLRGLVERGAARG